MKVSLEALHLGLLLYGRDMILMEMDPFPKS